MATDVEPTEPAPTGEPPRAGVRVGVILLVVGLAVGVVLLDQLTKLAAVSGLVEHDYVAVLGRVAGLQLERNAGAAYSFGAGYTWIFAVVAVAAAVLLVVYTRRIRSLGWATVFGLLLGGTLGNLGDRLFREPSFGMGHVVDFISLPWAGFVCNVADVAITAAVIAFLIQILLGRRFDGGAPASGGGAAPVHDEP